MSDATTAGAALFATESEARGTPTALLWKRYSSETFDGIAGALRDAGIPCCASSAANSDSSHRSFLSDSAAIVDTVKQMNWQIDGDAVRQRLRLTIGLASGVTKSHFARIDYGENAQKADRPRAN